MRGKKNNNNANAKVYVTDGNGVGDLCKCPDVEEEGDINAYAAYEGSS